jgi:hypothetical protein
MSKIERTIDYGFSVIADDDMVAHEDHVTAVEEVEQQLKEAQNRINKITELVIPMLIRLRDTAKDAYIHWPNRGPIMQDMINQIEALKKGK